MAALERTDLFGAASLRALVVFAVRALGLGGGFFRRMAEVYHACGLRNSTTQKELGVCPRIPFCPAEFA